MRLSRTDIFVLLSLIAIFLGSRWLWIVWSPNSILYFEESYRWVAINEFLNQRFHPWLEYQADHYQGGPLVMMIATSLVMAVVGQTPVVFKMVMAFSTCAVLVMLYLLAHRVSGRSAAWITALLYLSGPPLVATWSLVQLGSHAESVLFSLPLLGTLLYRPQSQRDNLRFVLAVGILAGVAVWFCYSAAIMVAACVVVAVLGRDLPSPRLLCTAATGFAVGLTPWLYYNLTYGWRGFDRVWELFGRGRPLDRWVDDTIGERIFRILFVDLPYGLSLGGDPADATWVTHVVAWVIALSMAVGVAFSLSRLATGLPVGRGGSTRSSATADERGRDVFAVAAVYSALFFAFLVVTSFTTSRHTPVNFRFYVPWAVVMILPLGVCLAELMQRRRRLAIALVVVLVVTNTFGTARYAIAHRDDVVGFAGRMGYAIAGLLTYGKYRDDITHVVEIADRIDDPSTKSKFLYGIGWGLALRLASAHSGGRVQMAWLAIESPPEIYTPIFFGLTWAVDGVATRFAERYHHVLSRDDAAGRRARQRIEQLHDAASAAQQVLANVPRIYWLIGLAPSKLPGRFPEDATRAAVDPG